MYSNLYSVQYKENGKVERDLVIGDDILFALKLYFRTHPGRLVLSITYQSSTLVKNGL